MCGIAGIFAEQFLDKRHIKNMTDTLRHRGPDDEGYLAVNTKNKKVWHLIGDDSKVFGLHVEDFKEETNLYLGHRRLSILDPTPSGHQPMSNDDGTLWVVFNGEIYNYIELKEELLKLGYHFKSNCDTEVLLKSYEAWGVDCLNRFNGMWAFVIYDAKKNLLFGARDRFGVKPLYFFKKSGYFAFASEIKSLITLPFLEKQINEKAVFDYVIKGLEEYQEESFFKDVYELKPSSYFIFDLNSGHLSILKYYELRFFEGFERYDDKKALEFSKDIKGLIFDAVKLRLRSDVSVGTCLSGGLDSSTVVCVINSFLNETYLNQIGDKQKVFTASYPGKNIDESKWAKIVVNSTITQWFQTFPEPEELMHDLEELVYYQDIPFGSTSIYAQYRVMELAKENGVKVLLDGQGGDELFGGYHVYYKVYLAELIKNYQFSTFFSELKHIRESGINPITGVLKNLLSPFFSDKLKEMFGKIKYPLLSYLSRDLLEANKERIFIEETSNNLNEFLYRHMTYLNLKTLLKYEDRNSMRFSIESRTPFADDINLIEYMFKIPSSYKIHNGWTKYILRTSMEGVIPKEIQWRRDKIGFATPEKDWLVKNKELLKSALKGRLKDFFEENKLLNDFDKILINQQDSSITPIWKIINFALWRKVYNV